VLSVLEKVKCEGEYAGVQCDLALSPRDFFVERPVDIDQLFHHTGKVFRPIDDLAYFLPLRYFSCMILNVRELFEMLG